MKLSEFALDLLYPPFCVICGQLLPIDRAEDALCTQCHAKWEQSRGECCPNCHAREDECNCTPPAPAALNAECAHLIPYRNSSNRIERMLLTAKDENYQSLFRFLGKALAERLEGLSRPLPSDALVTWLPRSYLRRAESGVDQAKKMAVELSKIADLTCISLFRRKTGGTQKELSAAARFAHARTSYELKARRPSLVGKTVVVVDDILTTGASMLAASDLLHKAGAERIVCLTVAQTRTDQKKTKPKQ